MSLAKKGEKLSRILSAVVTYQDKERIREADKAIRLRLAEEIDRLRRGIEGEKQTYLARQDLTPLPDLDRLASMLDKLANLIKYAGRGYRGLFDMAKQDPETLDRLRSFDLDLFEKVEDLQEQIAEIHRVSYGTDSFQDAVRRLQQSLYRFEQHFMHRQDILTPS